MAQRRIEKSDDRLNEENDKILKPDAELKSAKELRNEEIKDEPVPKKPVAPTTLDGKSEAVTIEALISSFSSLDFLVVASREIHSPSREDLLSTLLRQDEIKLQQLDRIKPMYEVWSDQPNRKYYIYRNSLNARKFTKLSELYESFLELFDIRRNESETYLREPDRVFIFSKRVYEPLTLGFPTEGIVTDSVSKDIIRGIIENNCEGSMLVPGIVETNAVGDRWVLKVSKNLISFSMNEMSIERELRGDFLNQIKLLRRQEVTALRSRNQFEFYYPTFPFNSIQGPFDSLRCGTPLRISFIEPGIMPIVRFLPIPTTQLVKSSGINLTRAAYLGDICNRSWKPDMNDSLFAFVLSLLMPGEILFDIDFRDNTLPVEVRGFAALIARLMFLFDEKSIYTNTTRETQISIDRALIEWGHNANVLTIPKGVISTYPLEDVTLSHANSDEKERFDYLKIRNGQGGACANGNLFLKEEDSLRRFFPKIMTRPNYVADSSDYLDILNGEVGLTSWRVYNAASIFLRKVSGNMGYASLLSVIAKRILEFFVRINEYSQVAWYTIFRLSQSEAALRDQDSLQLTSSRVIISVDFLLTVAKGLDNELLVSKTEPMERMRMESSFIKEGSIIELKWKYMENIFKKTNSLQSFPKRRRIEMVSKSSKVFSYIRGFMRFSDEDCLLPEIWAQFPANNRLSRCYSPLVTFDDEMIKFFRVLPSVNVNCKLNYITEQVMKSCMQDNRPLNNASVLENVKEYDYSNIEEFLRNRNFNSQFFKSITDPFKLRVLFPFEIYHSLEEFQNTQCLSKKNLVTTDVSFEHHIVNTEIKLLLMRLNEDQFIFDDDYVVTPYQIAAASPDVTTYSSIIVEANEFYNSLSKYISKISVLTTEDYVFVSLYDISLGGNSQ